MSVMSVMVKVAVWPQAVVGYIPGLVNTQKANWNMAIS
jgi:hypothetical protein